jgi:DNA-binding LacI/PurR family transcriptional regulator
MQTIAEFANKTTRERKMVRLKDVAEACGVSVATVSRALNGLTNENKERTAMICRTARDMGYYPNAAARTLKTSRSSNIGILYEDRMNHEYFSSLLDELRSEAERHGYDLTLIGRNSALNTESYYDHARRRNLDGVVVIQADFDSANVIRLASSDMPSVVIDHVYEGCDCVTSDNRASMARIVRSAHEHGHRKIGFITGQPGAVSRERLAGFYKICAELGIRVPEGFVREGKYHDPEGCIEIVRSLMKGEEKPTCILCPDDYSCLGALWDLKGEGVRIPEDLSLVGYDGIRMTRMMQPMLTTYRQNTEAIAREAIGLLVEAIETPEEHKPRQITVEGMMLDGDTLGELSR